VDSVKRRHAWILTVVLLVAGGFAAVLVWNERQLDDISLPGHRVRPVRTSRQLHSSSRL